MLQSPVSPESPDGRQGAGAFSRLHNYEAGLEVAENQNREKNDLDPVVVLSSPVDVDSPLYVSHGRWAEAPQAIDTTSPQAMGDAALESNCATTTTQTESDAAKAEQGSTLVESEKGEPKRYCGLGGKVMLLIVVLVLLLVAAIVGGAVGGTLAKKNKSPPATTSSSDATQSSPGTATGTQAAEDPTATEPTGPHVRFRLQTYDDYDYQGNIQVFDEPGLFRPKWPILSYQWTPARTNDLQDTSLLRCSVAFCANQTVLGWWGASTKTQPGDRSGNHSSNFLHIACDQMNLNPECKGLDSPAATAWAKTKDDYSQVPTPTPTPTGDGGAESSILRSVVTRMSTASPSSRSRSTSRSSAETSSTTGTTSSS